VSLFPEWQAAHAVEAALPLRIRQMWQMYSKDEAHKCGQCVFLERYKQGGHWMKCGKSKQTGGTGTDWRSSWPACGLFQQEERE
jgi:hypothetical protein